jgi:prophage antirepressor-like protein
MSALDIFTYSGQQVRTVVVDGEPWFVAGDVATILGYRMASDMTRRLDDDEKGTRSVRTPSGDQSMTVINEPGMYAAILGSQTPGAREFKRWLTHEVLPAIRKTGQFGSALPTNFAEALELAAVKVREIEALEAQAIADAPKVAAYNQLMDAEGFYTMEAVAKLGGIGRTTLFRNLREAGVIQSGSRLPYQRYMPWFKITASSWTDGQGVAHLSNTARVLPDALSKVLAKAGCQIEEAVAS